MLEYSFYIIQKQDVHFGMWIHLWVVECCTLFPGHCDLNLATVLEKCFGKHISLFEAGVTDLVCEYICRVLHSTSGFCLVCGLKSSVVILLPLIQERLLIDKQAKVCSVNTG